MREEIIGDCRLILGDCRDMMQELPKPDVVITDPPYLIKAGHGGGVFGERAHLVDTGGFTDSGVDHSFLSAFENWFCFCSRQQLKGLLDIASEFHRWNLITWAKPNPVPTCCNKYLPDVEYIVHAFSKGKLFGEFKDKQCFFCLPSKKETSHPNEKPIELMEKLVTLGTEKNNTVADFYMGSGTTGVSCVNLNRKFIGIEKDEGHFNTACRRIEKAAKNKPRLFDALPKTKPKQMTMV